MTTITKIKLQAQMPNGSWVVFHRNVSSIPDKTLSRLQMGEETWMEHEVRFANGDRGFELMKTTTA